MSTTKRRVSTFRLDSPDWGSWWLAYRVRRGDKLEERYPQKRGDFLLVTVRPIEHRLFRLWVSVWLAKFSNLWCSTRGQQQVFQNGIRPESRAAHIAAFARVVF